MQAASSAAMALTSSSMFGPQNAQKGGLHSDLISFFKYF